MSNFFFNTFLHFPVLLYKHYALKIFKNQDLELLTRHGPRGQGGLLEAIKVQSPSLLMETQVRKAWRLSQ